MPLSRAFYQRDTVTVARELLGTVLCRRTPEGLCAGRIVETEAYLGRQDPAAHSYKGKTDRVAVLFGPKGVSYIYCIYGIYHCLNLATGPADAPECVLIRALEPLEGLPLMVLRRGTEKPTALCSGPGKLCQALSLSRAHTGTDLTVPEGGLWLEPGDTLPAVTSPRIGIDYAGEAARWPLRFTAAESAYLSRPPGK